MSKRILVSLSKQQRQQVDELIERKIFTTINQVIRSSLDLLIRRERLQLWDRQLFIEYESGILTRHPKTGVLLSTRFQRELNLLVKEKEPQLRRGAWTILYKLTQKDPALEIKSLELKDYCLLKFVFKSRSWYILFRYHHQEIIACRISSTADQVWFE